MRAGARQRLQAAALLMLVAAGCSACAQGPGSTARAVHLPPVSLLPAPSPGGPIQDVFCVNTGDCWAVGHSAAPGPSHTVIERYNGTEWALARTPDAPRGVASSLSGVSCVSALDCWAVGTARSSGHEQGVTEQYNGVAWLVIRSGTTNVIDSALTSVTCPEDDDCWVVGTCSAAVSPACGGSSSLIELYDLIVPDGH